MLKLNQENYEELGKRTKCIHVCMYIFKTNRKSFLGQTNVYNLTQISPPKAVPHTL